MFPNGYDDEDNLSYNSEGSGTYEEEDYEDGEE